MTQTFAQMRSKLMGALARIGTNNGHACPQSLSNIDPVLHEYLVATDGASFFSKRRDAAKEALLSVADTEAINDAKARATKLDAGENDVLIAQGEVYRATVDVKRPAERLDRGKLRKALLAEGMTVETIEKVLDRSMTKQSPAVSIKISPMSVTADT